MTKHDNVSQGKIMKATEFVKKFGLDEAKEIVDGLPEKFKYKPLGMICWDNNSYKYSDRFKPRRSLVNMADLKRLVESHEILGLFKSLDQAKADVAACEYAGHAELLVKLDCGMGYINTAKVKQAIADVEACHEVN